MALSSKLEDWFFPFPALFLIPPALPSEGQCLQCGSRLCRSPSSSLQWGSPLLLQRDLSHYELLSHICTFTESKFTSCAKAQIFYGTPGFQYIVPPRFAATKKETKPSTHYYPYLSILGNEQRNEINSRQTKWGGKHLSIYKKDEPPKQSAHKRGGRSLLSPMTGLSLSPKTVAKHFEKGERIALSRTNPGMGLAENETILLSRLNITFDKK